MNTTLNIMAIIGFSVFGLFSVYFLVWEIRGFKRDAKDYVEAREELRKARNEADEAYRKWLGRRNDN